MPVNNDPLHEIGRRGWNFWPRRIAIDGERSMTAGFSLAMRGVWSGQIARAAPENGDTRMSDLSIELHWQRVEPELKPNKYSAQHTVIYNPQTDVSVDAAPDYGGDSDSTNPEQALASALSSCHMMTFLALAAKAGWPVASYYDRATAHLGRNPDGKMSVTRLDLAPVVRFDTGFSVSDAEMEVMQERAHRYCFVANSLADFVEVNIHPGRA